MLPVLALILWPAHVQTQPLHRWDFETGVQGWSKWSDRAMEQEARKGNAHSGHYALWGKTDERAALVHSIDGLRIPMSATLRFWYFVTPGSTFDHFTVNLRTHEHGEQANPIFQVSAGLRKGRWRRIELPFADFLGWSDRAFGSWTIRQFEVAATGVGEVLLDDVEVIGSNEPSPPVPHIIWVPGHGVTQAPGGARACFRKVFDLPRLPRYAWLQAGGDDEGTAWVNGAQLGTASLGSPAEYDLTPYLRVGRNVIALAVLNHGQMPNPSGALAVVGWGEQRADEHVIVSDDTWRASATAPEGWTDLAFDDSDWALAEAPFKVPGGPWGVPDVYPLRPPLGGPTPEGGSVSQAPRLPTSPPSQLARKTTCRGRATGFFHTERLGGRWWLVDPEGYLFFSVACNAVMHERSWSFHYNRYVSEHYPSEAAWRDCSVERLLSWGFNSSNGSPSDEPFADRNMPYFAGWNLTWAGPWLQNSAGERVMFPDVFDAEWKRGAEARVQEVTDQHRDDPLLIGYWTDNEIRMHEPLSPTQGIMDCFWSPGCQAELIRWLRERHAGDIEALNRQWSSPLHTYAYRTFDELPTDKPTARASEDPVAPDLRDFVRHIIETYADTYVALWKQQDPNHLVCTNRFAGQFDLEFADLLRPYDLIACNSYPRAYWGQTEFDTEQLQWLRGMHEVTGRPVIVSEWGTQAADSHLINVWGRLDTQAQRGECYENVIEQLWDEGYIVGAHWFSWGDSTDGERANWGLVDAYDRPYTEVTSAMTRAHRKLADRVRAWRP